mmetsp:Transcript_87246/g.182595  ORF Transcript_87246/g.182595 Transcript_87246/m.182595 type:complete len:419 (-) Transcript_87246:349-1605(-)
MTASIMCQQAMKAEELENPKAKKRLGGPTADSKVKKAKGAAKGASGTSSSTLPAEVLKMELEGRDAQMRAPLFLDEVYSVCSAIHSILASVPYEMPAAEKYKVERLLLSIAIEFCFAGSIALDGEVLRKSSEVCRKLRELASATLSRVAIAQSAVRSSTISGDLDCADDDSSPGILVGSGADQGVQEEPMASSVSNLILESLKMSPAEGITKRQQCVTQLLHLHGETIYNFLSKNPPTVPQNLHPHFSLAAQDTFANATHSFGEGKPPASAQDVAKLVCPMVAGLVPAGWVQLGRWLREQAPPAESSKFSLSEGKELDLGTLASFGAVRAKYLTCPVTSLCGDGRLLSPDSLGRTSPAWKLGAFFNNSQRQQDVEKLDVALDMCSPKEWEMVWQELMTLIVTKPSMSHADWLKSEACF